MTSTSEQQAGVTVWHKYNNVPTVCNIVNAILQKKVINTSTGLVGHPNYSQRNSITTVTVLFFFTHSIAQS